MKHAKTPSPENATSAIVYAYGGAAPVDGLDHALQERQRQIAMWDALVASDRAAERAQWDAARTDPQIDGLITLIDSFSEKITDAVTARRAARAKARAKVDTPELDERIAALAAERKTAQKTLWPLLAGWRKANKETVKAIEDNRRGEVKVIRQTSGLYWGNYNRVVDSFERARKLAKKTGGRPKFHRSDRTDGVLTVQIQSTKSGLGASMTELLSGAFNPLKIAPVDPAAFCDATPRGERKRMAHTMVEVRIDAAGHRLVMPIALHRLPSPEVRVKQAQVTWHREGERTRWQLALTCVGPSPEVAHPSPAACGIDIGWRLQPDRSLLVATTWDGSHLDRYVLPASWMAGMDQVERLASHVDDGVLELASAYHTRVADLPDDLRQPLMGWRPKLGARHVNVQGLHDAVRARIDAVRGSDSRADVPADIRDWYDRYRHLSLWRDDLRAKLQRQRREIYRLAARRIAGGYALIGIEDLDLAGMAKTGRRAPETGDNPLFAAARANRVRAASHLLLGEIGHQAKKHGSEVVTVAGPTTMHCHQCGGETGQRDRAERVWVCEHCGAVWDQDRNAAVNIYRAAVGDASGRVMRVAA